MSDNKPQVPFVPMNATTLAANVAVVAYSPNNGSISLQICEQRNAPIQNLGDKPAVANFEIGRFELTPRALRILLDSAERAAKTYGETLDGGTLPTIAQFDARGSMPSLENLIQPKPPGEQ